MMMMSFEHKQFCIPILRLLPVFVLLQCVHSRLAAVHRQRQAKKKVCGPGSSSSSSSRSNVGSSLGSRLKQQHKQWLQG
jgi:hypothetical protein